MAITYQDKWDLLIQHSIYDYLKTLLDADWNGQITIIDEWPEDKYIKMPKEYDALSTSEKRKYIRVPAISITLRNRVSDRFVGLGDTGQWNRIPIQIYIQAVSKAQFQVLSGYIANRFKEKSISIKNYNKYPDSTAAEIGRLETRNPQIRPNFSLVNVNSALKYGGVVMFMGEFING